MLNLYSSCPEHFKGVILIVVVLFTDDSHNAAVDQKHGAGPARGHTAVNGSTRDGDSFFGGLTDCVLLGMDCPHAMLGNASVRMNHLPHQVSHVVTMRQTGGASDISGNENLVVTGNHASASSTVTGGTLGNGTRNLHEIFIPGGSHIFFFWLLIFAHKNSRLGLTRKNPEPARFFFRLSHRYFTASKMMSARKIAARIHVTTGMSLTFLPAVFAMT